MQEKILKKVIPKFGGAGSEKLVDLLIDKQNVNEFIIAKKMNLTINQTRNMLYKLGDEGLIEFIRKKDKKKGGWYTYFWTLKIKRILQKYQDELNLELEKLKLELGKREKERFYYSPSIDAEYTEEEAMLNDFICPETGEVLQLRDNKELTEKIKVEMKKIEDALVSLNVEIEEVEKKEHKSTERKIKAEQKKKDLERKKKRVEREKEKKKLQKGKPVKKTAKKVSKSKSKKPKKKK
jgi:transcription initiation factor TFIIE subunit alpha